MYKKSEITKLSYKTGEVAKLLGVTPKTVQNYDKLGKLRVCRTESNRRCVMREDLLDFLDKHGLLFDDTEVSKKDIIYVRSLYGDAKLDEQAMYIINNTTNLQNIEVIKDVGSANNDTRQGILKLLHLVCDGEVRRVFVTAKDRLAGVGYSYISEIFKIHNVELIVVDGYKQLVECDCLR